MSSHVGRTERERRWSFTFEVTLRTIATINFPILHKYDKYTRGSFCRSSPKPWKQDVKWGGWDPEGKTLGKKKAMTDNTVRKAPVASERTRVSDTSPSGKFNGSEYMPAWPESGNDTLASHWQPEPPSLPESPPPPHYRTPDPRETETEVPTGWQEARGAEDEKGAKRSTEEGGTTIRESVEKKREIGTETEGTNEVAGLDRPATEEHTPRIQKRQKRWQQERKLKERTKSPGLIGWQPRDTPLGSRRGDRRRDNWGDRWSTQKQLRSDRSRNSRRDRSSNPTRTKRGALTHERRPRDRRRDRRGDGSRRLIKNGNTKQRLQEWNNRVPITWRPRSRCYRIAHTQTMRPNGVTWHHDRMIPRTNNLSPKGLQIPIGEVTKTF